MRPNRSRLHPPESYGEPTIARAGRQPVNTHTLWSIFDSRTGQRATIAAYSEAGARRALETTRRMVESGKRPDLREILPHLCVKPIRKE